MVPILFAKQEHYDVKRGGEFFNYLVFKFLVVEEHEGQWKATYHDGKPILLDIEKVSGFFEQTGKNTDYIIHPEEILAENFKLLVNDKRDVPSPDILQKIENVLIIPWD